MRVLKYRSSPMEHGRILCRNSRQHYNTIIKIILSKCAILDSVDFQSLGRQKQWHPMVWWMKCRRPFLPSGRYCLTKQIKSIRQAFHRVTISMAVQVRLKRWWLRPLPRWTCTRPPSSLWRTDWKPRTRSYCSLRRQSSPNKSLDYDSWTCSNRTRLQIKCLLYRLNLNHSFFLITRHPNKIIWSSQMQRLHQLLENQLD